jgi:lipid-binding SYLF domain-containing protein
MTGFRRFVFLVLAMAAMGCAHNGAAITDGKASPDDVATAGAQSDGTQDSKNQHRQKIIAMKDITLSDLYKLKPEAKDVIEKSEGYAVFDASGIYVVLYIGIAGRGVLIDNSTGDATYMTMARAGTGPGVGYQKFRSIIVFKNKKLLDTFRTVGGDIGASGHLVAKGFGAGGGVGGELSFDPMLSIYQITDRGLAAEASWGATVFAPDPTLNEARQKSTQPAESKSE